MAEMDEGQRKALEEKLKSMSPEELKEFQKKQCIFCRMVAGEVPAKGIYEDEHVFAILDINPANAGHVLLLPKEHYPIMQQMPDELVAHIGLIAKGFSQAFLQALKVEGSTIFAASGAVAGQRAQHVMVHLIPRKDGDGVGLAPASRQASPADLGRVRQALQPYVDKLLGVKRSEAPLKDGVRPAQVSGSAQARPPDAGAVPSTPPSAGLPAAVGKEGHPPASSRKEKNGVQGKVKPSRRKKDEDSDERDDSAQPEAGSSLDDIASFLTK